MTEVRGQLVGDPPKKRSAWARFSNSSTAPNWRARLGWLGLQLRRAGRPRRLVTASLIADCGDQHPGVVQTAPEGGECRRTTASAHRRSAAGT